MSCTVDSSESASITALSPEERYAIFLDMVIDADEVWVLMGDDEAVMMVDDNAVPCLPVWPHRCFARVTTPDDDRRSIPEPVDLDLFLKHWLPRLEADRLRIAVFPTPQATGLAVHPDKLRRDLKRE